MKRNILYIFDENIDAQRLSNSDSLIHARILIVPLTLDEKKICKVEEALKSAGTIEITRAPFTAYFNKKAFEVKDDFVKFIADFPSYDIGGKSLKEYFKYPFNAFSIWWFSLIAEKNTLKTDSFHNLVKLLTVKELREAYNCNEIWLDITDNNLASAIMYNKDALRASCNDLRKHIKAPEFIVILETIMLAIKYFLIYFSRSISAKCGMLGLTSHKKNLKRYRYLLITYFPNLDELQLKNGRFINKYYEPLQTALERSYKDSYAWLAMALNNSKYNWRENIRMGRRINELGNKFMFCEEWIGFFDWLKIFILYIYFSIKWFFCVNRLSKNFKYSKTSLNIWPLFRTDWHSSFCGYPLLEGLLYYSVFSNVFSRLEMGTKVTYFAEMHGWEKALNAASRKYKKIKTFGIQHTIVPLQLLMYFNDAFELQDGNYVQTMPRPDHLACVGEIPVRLFKDSGWKEGCVFSWGPLRFQHFKNCLENITAWEKRKDRVIIALSIMPEVSKEMLLYAYYAFKPAPGFEVFIKSHPNLCLKSLMRKLDIEFDETTFTICDSPLETLLLNSKAVIVTESSAALEAVACGSAVIIPRLVNFIDMNPLSGLSDLPIYAENPQQLRDIAGQILRKEGPPFSITKCRDFISRYCNPLDSDNDFLRKLEEIGD